MATWEDGPEYAPLQPPSEFAAPDTPPLEVAPPVIDIAAGAPFAQPRFNQPTAPVAPLATLVPAPPDPRDPQLPFDVVASTATADSSAWSAAHYTAPSPGESAGPGPFSQPAPAWPAPVGPPQTPDPYSPFAAPNTPAWFAPPPPDYPAPASNPLTANRLWNAASPGALITLGVGALVYPLSPITIAVALGLSTRLTVARARVVRAYGIGLTLLAFVAVIALLVGRYDSAEWWLLVGRWGQVISIALIVTVLVLVAQTLRGRLPDGGRRPGSWG